MEKYSNNGSTNYDEREIEKTMEELGLSVVCISIMCYSQEVVGPRYPSSS
jgi:hypothetical protein